MPYTDAGTLSALTALLQSGPTRYLRLVNQQFTAPASSDTFTSLTGTSGSTTTYNHGLAVGDVVLIGPLKTQAGTLAASGAALGGVTNGGLYFVTAVTATTFKIATTSNGTAITTTAAIAGGWMRKTAATMGAVAESATPGTQGYAAQAIAPSDWGAAAIVNGNYQSSAAQKTFGPVTAQTTFTHTAIALSATTTTTELTLLTPASQIADIPANSPFLVTPKIQFPSFLVKPDGVLVVA